VQLKKPEGKEIGCSALRGLYISAGIRIVLREYIGKLDEYAS
jgi:hypothetical protein